MMDTSLLAAGAILMQSDAIGDLHPCTYFSMTFSVTEHNYDIYDWELLAVILALAEWKQYLQGTTHPIFILTDHKNLSYLKDPHKLSCQQAHWSLFLQDFNVVWRVTPGMQMGLTDALSHKDYLDTTADNENTPILPNPMVINALNLILAHHIQSSSTSDPFILHALSALNEGSLLWMQEQIQSYYRWPSCFVTWMGNTHEETNVLPSNGLSNERESDWAFILKASGQTTVTPIGKEL